MGIKGLKIIRRVGVLILLGGGSDWVEFKGSVREFLLFSLYEVFCFNLREDGEGVEREEVRKRKRV